ncbi:WecB/TagA/CpsF family glycosyltransferase [Cyanobium sp. NIES-981]|uniref:WecB/TagA/CpsF family glycosyltransferase n=1 Tax=Cyanobium sp. NIES-981 TaxID=1851505 RepID=UPI0007DE1172|nr:WecB/TagA/CpsF family glycosyltransferase [Cyanobium sp. NIES-981]SBO43701.1 Glycosyl transferase WecB/TagA/CpsF family [Cyanobium sp. NIES-981]
MASKATEARSPGRRSQVLTVPIDVCPDVREAALALHASGGGQIVTLNAEMTMAALANPALGQAIAAADLVIPDGAGVVWALGRQGFRVRRTPGIELAHSLLVHAAQAGWRVALVGAGPEVMARLVERLRQELPALQLERAIHGFQPAEAWPAIEAELVASAPDLVLVALGVPRQELWIQQLPGRRGGLWMGVGGSFDVWAGVKKRAPRWMGALHIEWLYRLLQEPSRWRRMLALPAFAWRVLLEG